MSIRQTLVALSTAAVAASAIVLGATSASAQERGQCLSIERQTKFYPEVRHCADDKDPRCYMYLPEGHAVRFDRERDGGQYRVRTILGFGWVRGSETRHTPGQCDNIPRPDNW